MGMHAGCDSMADFVDGIVGADGKYGCSSTSPMQPDSQCRIQCDESSGYEAEQGIFTCARDGVARTNLHCNLAAESVIITTTTTSTGTSTGTNIRRSPDTRVSTSPSIVNTGPDIATSISVTSLATQPAAPADAATADTHPAIAIGNCHVANAQMSSLITFEELLPLICHCCSHVGIFNETSFVFCTLWF